MTNTRDLLIEIGTEELPPKALLKLSQAFSQGILAGLKAAQLDVAESTDYAAPRRLAIYLSKVPVQQAEQTLERRGPAVKAAFKDGNPTKAAEGFARSCGVSVDQLGRQKTDKGEWLSFRKVQEGKKTADLLPNIVNQSLAKLPIPKRMRWGDSEVEFVRPVHWVVMLSDDEIIEAEILGIKTGRTTLGHRFHAPQPIDLAHAKDYAETLQNQGQVTASFTARQNLILEHVKQTAAKLGGKAVVDPDLLNEVTALVEKPVAVAGNFEARFLDVPQEALISTMQDNQKYFPIVDAEGTLMPHFITISNIDSKDVSKVSEGNERVIRPRFADAEFFWAQDRKRSLETWQEATQNIVFQKRLGTLHEKSERVAALSAYIADELNANTEHAVRAAQLSKCDLMSDMVFEFAALQGIMGRYYATHFGEPKAVSEALEEQYHPRYAGDALPASETGQILAIADRIDTLSGIFAIGQKPSGTKDPFALRRAALSVLRIIIECDLSLDLEALLAQAATGLADKVDAEKTRAETFDYIMERLKAYYLDQGIETGVIDAVMAQRPTQPQDFDQRVKAVARFHELSEAKALAAANKRISNILKKIGGELPSEVAEARLIEEAEKALFVAIQTQQSKVIPLFEAGDYKTALLSLASLREPVDTFFDHVMVMADDDDLKRNRIALLNQLRALFLRVADLSRLQ